MPDFLPLTKQRNSVSVAESSLISFQLDSGYPFPFAESVQFSHAIRRALMSRCTDDSFLFSGKRNGVFSLDGHQHATYFCLPDSAGTRVDKVCLFSPEPLSESEQAACDSLREIRISSRVSIGVTRQSPTESRALFTTSSEWWSLTPFCLNRHPKKNGKDGPVQQMLRELSNRGFPPPLEIDLMPPRFSKAWPMFQLARPGKKQPSTMAGFPLAWAFRLVFSSPISGPLFLGHESHFGLGLFMPRTSLIFCKE